MNPTQASMIIILASTIPASADKIHLQNGDVISGEYEIEGDKTIVITDDGRSLEFDNAQIKRRVRQANVTLDQAADMLDELTELARPVLSELEPAEYLWLKNVFNTNSQFSRDSEAREIGARETLTRQGELGQSTSERYARRAEQIIDGDASSTTVSETMRDKTMDEVFVAEWKRYANQFELLESDPRFRELTSTASGSGSLADFADNPPEGLETEAASVKEVLRSLRTCFMAIDRATRLIDTIPGAKADAEEKIREYRQKAKYYANKAKTDLDHRDRYMNKSTEYADKAAKKQNDMITDLETKNRVAGDKIIEFAALRGQTVNELTHADRILRQAFGDEYVPPRTAEYATPFELTEAISAAEDILRHHHADLEGLTTLAREQRLRETTNKITQCFTTRPIHMLLEIEDLLSTDEGRYLLTAAGPANSNPPNVSVHLTFDPPLQNDLNTPHCAIGEKIAVVATIQSVDFTIPQDSPENESPKSPRFSLNGALTSVVQPCHP